MLAFLSVNNERFILVDGASPTLHLFYLMQNEEASRAVSKVCTPLLMKEHLIHRRNVCRMKAVMKITEPPTYSHLYSRSKQEYLKQS